MTYNGINIGEAVQPMQDRVETYQSNGYAVVSPGDALSAGSYAVTVNSGDLNASDTLSVGSSNDEILFDGSVKSLSSATNITINGVSAAGDGTEQYRYDVIYADSSGEVQKTEGSVTKLDSRESQNNLTRFERFKGAIPNPGTDPSVIIGAVIVNSNDTSVGTSQLRDYRVPATTTADTVDANTVDTTTTNTANLDGGVTGNTTVSDIIGSGVEVVSGSLQAALGDGVSLSGNDITAALGGGLDFASGNIQILDSIWDAANTELTADVNNSNTTTDALEANDALNAENLSGSSDFSSPRDGIGFTADFSIGQKDNTETIIADNDDKDVQDLQAGTIDCSEFADITVFGYKKSDSNVAFVDRLQVANFNVTNTVPSSSTTISRSFRIFNAVLELAIDDSSNEYNIAVISQGGRVA